MKLRLYRILDYKNGKIISGLFGSANVCVSLAIVEQYSDSFDVMDGSGKLVTSEFSRPSSSLPWEHDCRGAYAAGADEIPF